MTLLIQLQQQQLCLLLLLLFLLLMNNWLNICLILQILVLFSHMLLKDALFPSQNSPKTSKDRASFLCSEFSVAETSILKDRALRNDLAHLDERLDNWAMSSQNKTFGRGMLGSRADAAPAGAATAYRNPLLDLFASADTVSPPLRPLTKPPAPAAPVVPPVAAPAAPQAAVRSVRVRSSPAQCASLLRPRRRGRRRRRRRRHGALGYAPDVSRCDE